MSPPRCDGSPPRPESGAGGAGDFRERRRYSIGGPGDGAGVGGPGSGWGP